MPTIKASEFKARCLKLMDQVNETGEEITITKNGEAVARLVPLKGKRRFEFGRSKNEIKIIGDIEAPIWDEFDVVAKFDRIQAETDEYHAKNRAKDRKTDQ